MGLLNVSKGSTGSSEVSSDCQGSNEVSAPLEPCTSLFSFNLNVPTGLDAAGPRSAAKSVRAAIYARVSTANGRQDTENQIAHLRQFGASQNWEIMGLYIDHESGKTGDRPEFKRLFADAGKRRFDLVLVWALDRLTREGVAETFECIKRLDLNGVQFVSFTEEHFRTTGPAGELMVAVAAWIAKQERVRISERVRAGLSRARTHGTRSGRPVGRPRVVIDGDRVLGLRETERLSWPQIARKMHAGSGSVRRAYKLAQERRRAAKTPTLEPG